MVFGGVKEIALQLLAHYLVGVLCMERDTIYDLVRILCIEFVDLCRGSFEEDIQGDQHQVTPTESFCTEELFVLL